MPFDTIWFNKSETKLSFTEVPWKKLMNECLMNTQIFKSNKNINEKNFCNLDPNFVMDIRHGMVKHSSEISPTPQVQIHTDALKLLRIENHNRYLKQKEGKTVEKEIARFKQILENKRLLTKKKIDGTTNIKTKTSLNTQLFPIHDAKLCKRLEICDKIFEADAWLSPNIQIMETINGQNQQEISLKVEVPLKGKVQMKKSLELTSTNSEIITEHEVDHSKKIWKINEGKSEILKRFFEKDAKEIKQELQDNFKKRKNTEKSFKIENAINQKRIENAWEIWKTFTEVKDSRTEKLMYKNKIEAFLLKLKEKEAQEKIRHFKNEIKINVMPKYRAKTSEKQMINEEKEEKLKNLIQEVKTSQAEAYSKIQEVTKTSFKNQRKSLNLKFLERMEHRRTERLKRRQEIQEKKRKLEEEREKTQKQEEKNKKLKEEEIKKKSLEETKEKRRLEEEKKEKQKREREKLRLSMRLAQNYYDIYVLRSFGLRPWVKLKKMRDWTHQQAVTFFEKRLAQKMFWKWIANVREQARLKILNADEFYERMLKQKCLLIWATFHKKKVQQDLVAKDWNDFRITEKALKKWIQFTENEQSLHLNKKHTAQLNYERKLKVKCFKKLRDYPELKKLEEEKKNRKWIWRQKVKEIIPDYQPQEISEEF